MSTIPTSLESFETQASDRSPALRTVLVGLLSLMAGAAAAGMLAGRDAPRFSGRIEAQTTFVNAGHAGIVTELLVKEGDRVSLEHPLATLTDPELEARITQSSADLSVLLSERTQVEATAEVELAWRLKEIDESIVAYQLRSADYLKEKFDWELERSMWADVLSSNETVMFDDGEPEFKSMLLKSRVPAEQRMNAMLKHETADNAVAVSGVQVEICHERLAQLQRSKEQLSERIRQRAGVEVVEQRIAQQQGALALLEARRTNLVVKSTAIGTVGVFRAHPGDHLQPGQPIVEILDDARRWVVASVPSSVVPEFAPQRMVRLTFPGGLVRTGQIVAIAPQADRSAAGDELDPPVAVRSEQTAAAWPNIPLGSRVDVQLAE
jgi:multidrug resistance efflux pump